MAQIGVRARDLEALGRAYLDNWGRSQAKVELLDAYFAEHGFLDGGGEPRPAARVYFTAVNSARLALARLEDHLRARPQDPMRELNDYLADTYGGDDDGRE